MCLYLRHNSLFVACGAVGVSERARAGITHDCVRAAVSGVSPGYVSTPTVSLVVASGMNASVSGVQVCCREAVRCLRSFLAAALSL